jgi:parallel beta-helix repeat protein
MKRALVTSIAVGVLGLTAATGSATADGGTAVTCGSTIASPGEYYLPADCTGPGIIVAANDVHLKLDGHTMTGPGTGGSNGILATQISGLHLQGPGTITNYGAGIYLSGNVDNSHVEDLTVSNNSFQNVIVWNSDQGDEINDVTATDSPNHGFTVYDSSQIKLDHDTALNNGGWGFAFTISTDSTLSASTASGNYGGIFVNGYSGINVDGNASSNNIYSGIWLTNISTDNQIHGNSAFGNGGFDLRDDNPACDSNNWEGNRFNSSNQPCIS